MKLPLAVAAGGAIGAPLRLAMSLWLTPHGMPGFPWGTLACNLSGSLALGLWTGYVLARPGMAAVWKEFVGTGLIGSYTTFSAFSLELVVLLQQGETFEAALYFTVSLLAGLALAAAGLRLMRSAARRNRA
ncbi:fluoride efflux transporter CrcB [Paenibacillus sp. SYP-B4298]|uniref:fluoride efflux transporter CrcB n=1 Tax=Paenibacillus sp. SYP-B4298 TaxID=2996034 RepID=UPI0022DD4D42|nr:fluoride efflux transporter CrcB [Paenibacillus sp. SYP-B4298]